MTNEPLTIPVLERILAYINQTSYLVCHPDDETMILDALEKIPANLRPTVVANANVPGPGTAYYSRSVPVDTITKPPIDLLPPATSYRRTAYDVAMDYLTQLEEGLDQVDDDGDDTAPLHLPNGELIAGERAARYRRVQRAIRRRLATATRSEDHIDPLKLISDV